MTVHIIDINSQKHEIYCDEWATDADIIKLLKKGYVVAIFHRDKVIGFTIAR